MVVAKKTKLPGTTTSLAATDAAPATPSRTRRLVVLGIVGLGVVVAAVLVFVHGHHNGSPPAGTVNLIRATLYTQSGLKTLAGASNSPIYWVGPVPGDRYEVTRTANNDLFIRYLPLGVDAGSRQGKYLLIATYPLYKALASLKATAHGHSLKVAHTRGGIAVVERGKTTNLRVAFPNVDYEVEVYDPSPKRAKELATSGALTPVP
jgi:hypothetical protein